MRQFLLVALITHATRPVLPDDLNDYCNDVGSTSHPPPREGAVQVHVLVRHGARTIAWPPPANGGCWTAGPAANKAIEFDCGLAVVEGSALGARAFSPFAFRKVFRAGRNFWGGNCMMGGLVDDGYRQHEHNGRLIRSRFIGKGRLVDSTVLTLEQGLDAIEVRSDDFPRVLQSTQALASSMLDGTWADGDATQQRGGWPVAVPHIVNDIQRDTLLYTNEICGAQKRAVFAEYEASESRIAAVSRYEPLSAELKRIAVSERKMAGKTVADPLLAADCIYAATCRTVPSKTNWALPDQVSANGFALGRAILAAKNNLMTGQYTYKDSAKWLVGPLLRDVRYNIVRSLARDAHWGPVVMGAAPGGRVASLLGDAYDAVVGAGKKKTTTLGSVSRRAPRLFVYGGHDSEPLAPLFAFLGVKGWPKFASLSTVELFGRPSGDRTELFGGLRVRVVVEGDVRPTKPCAGAKECSLEEFLRYADKWIPTRDECPLMPVLGNGGAVSAVSAAETSPMSEVLG